MYANVEKYLRRNPSGAEFEHHCLIYFSEYWEHKNTVKYCKLYGDIDYKWLEKRNLPPRDMGVNIVIKHLVQCKKRTLTHKLSYGGDKISHFQAQYGQFVGLLKHKILISTCIELGNCDANITFISAGELDGL